MTPRPTTDVSHLYGQQQAASTFGDSRYGGDVLALASGRVDEGRWQLHAEVEAEAARSGLSYEQALDSVIGKARAGVLALSQAARVGLGLGGAPVPGVRTLSAAAAELPERPQDSTLFADTMAACAAARPGATGEDQARSTGTILARCDPQTAHRQVGAWIAAGGAAAAGVRFG